MSVLVVFIISGYSRTPLAGDGLCSLFINISTFLVRTLPRLCRNQNISLMSSRFHGRSSNYHANNPGWGDLCELSSYRHVTGLSIKLEFSLVKKPSPEKGEDCWANSCLLLTLFIYEFWVSFLTFRTYLRFYAMVRSEGSYILYNIWMILRYKNWDNPVSSPYHAQI